VGQPTRATEEVVLRGRGSRHIRDFVGLAGTGRSRRLPVSFAGTGLGLPAADKVS